MQFLSNEKDKLSGKLQVAIRLMETHGLIAQFQLDLAEKQPTGANMSGQTSTTHKGASSVKQAKINKQYLSASLAAEAQTVSALNDCTNEQTHHVKAVRQVESESTKQPQQLLAADIIQQPTHIEPDASLKSILTYPIKSQLYFNLTSL